MAVCHVLYAVGVCVCVPWDVGVRALWALWVYNDFDIISLRFTPLASATAAAFLHRCVIYVAPLPMLSC